MAQVVGQKDKKTKRLTRSHYDKSITQKRRSPLLCLGPLGRRTLSAVRTSPRVQVKSRMSPVLGRNRAHGPSSSFCTVQYKLIRRTPNLPILSFLKTRTQERLYVCKSRLPSLLARVR